MRNRAKDLLALINDDEALREERKKAKKNRDKYVGVGSDGTKPTLAQSEELRVLFRRRMGRTIERFWRLGRKF